MSETKNVKFVVFVPVTHAEVIRKVLSTVGAGSVRNYDTCSFSVRGVGRFRPLEGAEPTIGEIGNVEMVDEERIEVLCPRAKIKQLISEVKEKHPYEDVAYDVYPVENDMYE